MCKRTSKTAFASRALAIRGNLLFVNKYCFDIFSSIMADVMICLDLFSRLNLRSFFIMIIVYDCFLLLNLNWETRMGLKSDPKVFNVIDFKMRQKYFSSCLHDEVSFTSCLFLFLPSTFFFLFTDLIFFPSSLYRDLEKIVFVNFRKVNFFKKNNANLKSNLPTFLLVNMFFLWSW